MTRLQSGSAGPRGQLRATALVALREQRRRPGPREGGPCDRRRTSECPAARGAPRSGLYEYRPSPSCPSQEQGGGHSGTAVWSGVLLLSAAGVALERRKANTREVS